MRIVFEPFCEHSWYDFDDSVVFISDEEKDIVARFGGKGYASAYMLVYPRQRDLDWLFRDVPDSKVPYSVMGSMSQSKAEPSVIHLSIST